MEIIYLNLRKLSAQATTPTDKKPDEMAFIVEKIMLSGIRKEYIKYKERLTALNISESKFFKLVKTKLSNV